MWILFHFVSVTNTAEHKYQKSTTSITSMHVSLPFKEFHIEQPYLQGVSNEWRESKDAGMASCKDTRYPMGHALPLILMNPFSGTCYYVLNYAQISLNVKLSSRRLKQKVLHGQWRVWWRHTRYQQEMCFSQGTCLEIHISVLSFLVGNGWYSL